MEGANKAYTAAIAYFSLIQASPEDESIATRFLEQLLRDGTWAVTELEEVKRLIQARLQPIGN